MNKSNKVLAGLGLVAIVAVWPFAVGQIAQKNYVKFVEQNNNEKVSSEIVEYKRGYLSSQVTTKITILDEGVLELLSTYSLPGNYEFKTNFKHGMLGITGTSKLTEFTDLPMTLISKHGLLGSTSQELNIEAFDYSDMLGKGLTMGKVVIEAKTSDMETADVSYQIDDISMDDGYSNIVVKGISGKASDVQLNFDKFVITKQEAKIASLVSKGMGEQEWKNIVWQQDGHVKNNILNITGSLGVESITQGGMLPITLNDFKLATQAQLDNESVQTLYQIFSNSEVNENEFVLAFDELIQKGVNLSIDNMSFSLAGSDFSSALNVKLPKNNLSIDRNFPEVLDRLEGDLSVFIDTSIEKNMPFSGVAIEQFKAMQVLTTKADKHEIKAKLENAVITFDAGYQRPLL